MCLLTRWLGFLICALFLSSAQFVKAATYNMDMFGSPPAGISIGGTGGARINICSANICADDAFATLFYEFRPGDTVNFGSIELESFVFGDGRSAHYYGPPYNAFGYPIALYNGALTVEYQYTPFISLYAPPVS